MAYTWDTAIAGQIGGNNGFHDTYFMRAYVLKVTDHKYLATPPPDDYLMKRQRGQLEGLIKQHYGENDLKKTASNTSYERTGNYDIASKLGLYNAATSFTMDLYAPKRNSYQKEKSTYLE